MYQGDWLPTFACRLQLEIESNPAKTYRCEEEGTVSCLNLLKDFGKVWWNSDEYAPGLYRHHRFVEEEED